MLAPKSGPAIIVAAGLLLGAMLGIPWLLADQAIGYFTIIPGSIAGGLAYRIWTVSFPIDRTMKVRSWIYAAVAIILLTAFAATLYLPSLTSIMRAMFGRGLGQALGLSLIVGTFALGMALSGDRRAAKG